MATLLLRLQGPLQSWGITSRFDERETQLEPSKSGVLGLVCAALGRDRQEPIEDLTVLHMGVRVDREGILMRDFQTVGGDRDNKKKTIFEASGALVNRTILSPRFFLADAVFLAGLEGNIDLLGAIHQALKAPVWPLCLGRKSFVPSYPVYLPDGLRTDQTLLEAFATYPRLCGSQTGDAPGTLRCVWEDAHDGTLRMDQPIAPFAQRRFGPRLVRSGGIHVPHQVIP